MVLRTVVLRTVVLRTVVFGTVVFGTVALRTVALRTVTLNPWVRGEPPRIAEQALQPQGKRRGPDSRNRPKSSEHSVAAPPGGGFTPAGHLGATAERSRRYRCEIWN